jgi:hypothetical protein
MSASDELREQILEARDAFRSALAAAPWSDAVAGVVAEAAKQELWYASAVCAACGYPGLEIPEYAFANAEAAQEGYEAAVAKAQGRIKYVQDPELEKPYEKTGDVAGLLREYAQTVRAEAAQLEG